MHVKTLMMSLGLLCLTVALQPAGLKAGEQENAVLAQVLQLQHKDGGFTVVNPVTAFGRRTSSAASIKNTVENGLRIEGYDIDPLLDKLIEKNKGRTRLSLKSSPENGYIVDYDGKFEKYFEENGGGWKKLYKENPAARGLTRISLPAYDEQAGIVLVYIGRQSARLAGAGYIVAYRYEDGKLKELGRVMLWIIVAPGGKGGTRPVWDLGWNAGAEASFTRTISSG
jgi:hypothetical protein